jgi:hypothetical protein
MTPNNAIRQAAFTRNPNVHTIFMGIFVREPALDRYGATGPSPTILPERR